MTSMKKKMMFLVTMLLVVVGLASCADANNTVRIQFEKDTYEIRMHGTHYLEPIIKASATVDLAAMHLGYESLDEEIVEYTDGVLMPKKEGVAQIKVYWKEKEVVFDKATVIVTKAALPTLVYDAPAKMLKNEVVEVAYELLNNYTEATATFKALTPDVATITEDGKITALSVGEAEFEVEVKDAEETATYNFKVQVQESDFAIHYVLDGGTNAEENPIGYNALELPLELLEPTKANYEFMGWKWGEEIVTSLPAGTTGDVTLVATWKAVEYKISYELSDGENAENNPATYTVEDLPLALEDATKENYEFLGWYLNDEKVEELVEGLTGDVVLVAKFEGQKYNVTYNVDGGTLPADAPAYYQYGEGLQQLPLPTREGYKFLGWFNENGKVESIAADATGDVTVTAKWEPTEPLEYDIEWVLNGGSWSKTIESEGYASYEAIVADVLKDFGVSSVSKWAADFDDKFRANSEKWNKLLDYFLAVRADDGYNKKITDCKNGVDLAGDTDPYVITGELKAFAEKTVINYPSAQITSCDYSDAAVREKIWDFFEKGEPEIITVEHPDKYEVATGLATLPTPFKEGDTFVGWFVKNEKWDQWESIPAGTKGNLTFTAKWESEGPVNPVESPITFNVDGGTMPAEFATSYVEGVGLATLPVPTREGYQFLGWFDENGKVTSIGTEVTGEVVLSAKWEEEAKEYSIEYSLDGGSWPVKAFTTREEAMAGLLKDFTVYFQSLGWTGTEISVVEDAAHVTDFMGVSYSYATQIQAFFTDARFAAKWGWVMKYITDKGANLSSTTLVRANIHAFIYQTEWPSWPYSANFSDATFETFKDKLPAGEELVPPTIYEAGKKMELPRPVKEGFDFAGWYNGTEVIIEITEATKGDLALTARWRNSSGEEGVILVGPEQAYKTIDEAMAVALPGDTIKIEAGEYQGGTINVANVTILGPNAQISAVTGTRKDEAIFKADIVIDADGVTIDGISLTGEARLVGSENGTKDTTITNVLISGCTLNKVAADSTNAPLYFFTKQPGAKYVNLKITNVANVNTKENRGMIMYGACFENLTIENCKFVGKRSNYNDGIKLGADGSEFGVRGEVNIIGNHFENYSQYVIWFRTYSEGTYNVENNTFVNNGQTASNHASISFITYLGAADAITTINYRYNTVQTSYAAIRIDKHDSRTADTQIVHVNYNKIYDCQATYFVNNKNAYEIDATKNYYDKTPTDALFNNATFDPYYDDDTKVPAYGQPLNFFDINYELRGGEFDGKYPTSFDSYIGLDTLPTPVREGWVFLGWWNLAGFRVTSIAAGTEHSVTLIARWREDALYVGSGDAEWIYATLEEALAVAKEGDKIIILAGEYEENITITVANLTIVGPNEGKNSNVDERSEEAVLKGVITVAKTAHNLKLEGLAFTGNATIKNTSADGLNGFKFINNKVYDTTEATSAWQETAGATGAFIEFVSATTGKEVSNFVFQNNLFENISAYNILLTRSMNISFDGNVFLDFGRDAIRFDTGGYNYGILAFTNNRFEQTEKGHGHHAIYFRIYGGGSGTVTNIYVQNNVFKQIGNETVSSVYNGAIGARNYQENEAHWYIEDNVFDNCYNYIRIRNNGAKSDNWTCKIEDNQFLGVPNSFYYANYTGSDNSSTNPNTAEFTKNYYEDNEGKVITDLTQYQSLFKELKTYGSALGEKPVAEAVEPVEFYTIAYDLDGGSIKGTLTKSYSSLIAEPIAIPAPTKVNHQFLGWELDGALVTEIPTTSRGNLVLTAKWQVLEGEFYKLDFVTDKGEWPTRDAEDRTEILDNLYKDLYEWAVGNGETKSYDDYVSYVNSKLAGGEDIKFRNITLGAYPAEDGSTEYFLNIPKYYDKWIGFFKVFQEAMFKVNASQDFFRDTYASMIRLNQFITWSTTGQNYFSSFMPQFCKALQLTAAILTEYRAGQIVNLPVLTHKGGLEFLGWYDNPEFTGEAYQQITATMTGDLKFYAKWEAEVVATEVTVNTINELLQYSTHQLVWSFNPANTTNQQVEFFSSDESVASVTQKGLITAHKHGTTTITMKVYGNRDCDVVFDVTVFSPDRIEVRYDTVPYADVEEELQLNATYIPKVPGTEGNILWSSLNEDIATVDAYGKVTTIKAGYAVIVAKLEGNEEVNMSIGITVVEGVNEMDELLAYLASQSLSTIISKEITVTGYQFIYKHQLNGSVNNYLFKQLVIDEKYMVPAGASNRPSAKVDDDGNPLPRTTYEKYYVTVHDTASSAKTATAESHGSYVLGGGGGTSWQYSVGNDGIFHQIPDDEESWHAGDGGRAYGLNATGVTATVKHPKVTITSDGYYALDGKKTTVVAPTNGGTILTTEDINDVGIQVVIKDGQYFIGNTYFNSTYKKISNTGGNKNSIGMETMVNIGSDLYLTWQHAAKLCAHLVKANGLTVDDVKPHHFFSGKNCPQTMRDNGLWENFLKLVAAEYKVLTEYADYEITFESHNPEYLDNTGRVIKQPNNSMTVSYTITVTKEGVSKSIRLSSVVPGIYNN